tara:strand:- start:6222 stop:7610 length:1389 start_codon:yes stop_codon:yes gene_type:complete
MGVAGAFPFLASSRLFAQPAALAIRYSVDTPAGAAMAVKYAEAVRRMNAASTAVGSPRSWTFQWYIHAVPATKQAELDRIYGHGPSAIKSLASATWNTCQGHFPGSNPAMFLPWHRMYILAFEDICRAVLNDQTFTLPYWDYTRPGGRSLPAAFRTGTAVGNALYRANRNTGLVNINAGEPMDKLSRGDPYGLDAMKRPTYAGPTGFCSTLDQGLHGNVHTGIGDGTNMGRVPTAANDPIFWLHHCNIDRIWAAWNAAGGINQIGPGKFLFAGPEVAGKPVEWEANAVGETAALGYRYDSLPPSPSGPISAGTAGGRSRTVATGGSVTLDKPVTVTMRMTPVDGAISGSVLSATATGRALLVLRDLSANLNPGTLYEAYIDLPADASAAEREERYLGTFSFFGATDGHAHGGHGPNFDITERIVDLRARDLLSAETQVTIVPLASVADGAEPVVGSIDLVRQ